MRVRIGWATTIVLLSSLGGSAATAQTSNLPDLVPLLPETGQLAPVYVDQFQIKGRVLYRFDAVLENDGGALDMFRDPATGDVMQAIWNGGAPDSEPVDPNRAPSEPNLTLEDRTRAAGASFVYDDDEGHGHWHLAAAAAYELLVPNAAPRPSAKVGFCLADTYGAPAYFPYGFVGTTGPNTFCAPGEPSARFVRMGISRGAGDYYASQVANQWIDVTGLRPGRYTLRAVVNPTGVIDESSTADNVIEQTRLIPGTTAVPLTAAARGAARFRLEGSIVAPEIPARKSVACVPTEADPSCYLRASAAGPLRFRLRQRPRHGTVVIAEPHGLHAVAVYTPHRGYIGDDSFTYTVTDDRGLTSAPALVRLRIAR